MGRPRPNRVGVRPAPGCERRIQLYEMQFREDQPQGFRQSLHGSFEAFQRDQRLEEAFYACRGEVQKNLGEENLFSNDAIKSDAEAAVREIQETGPNPGIIRKIHTLPVFASHVCIECLHRMSFQVVKIHRAFFSRI